jgi:hypothetical protein
MRKPVVIPAVVLVLIALCFAGWFILVHRRANAGLSTAEYDVLSAYLNSKAKDVKARKLVVLDTTESDERHTPMNGDGQPIPWAETAKFLQEKAPTLQAATLDAFRRANRNQVKVRQSFNIAIDYGIADSAVIDPIFKKGGGSWPAYYKQFPESQGVLTFARVGFNPEGTQALLYWSNYCGGLCGGGGYVVLEKREAHWIVRNEIEMWIS